MRLQLAGITDVGKSRDSNEDNFFISEREPLCIVADGMGGHRSGEVASSIAIQTIREFYENPDVDPEFEEAIRSRIPNLQLRKKSPGHPEERRLLEATLLANERIYGAAAEDENYQGMGTTLVGAYFLQKGAYLVHVGDSRAYRYRDGEIEQITQDHSLAREYLQMGILNQNELEHFPYRNVITRALGLHESVEPEIRFMSIESDDIYVFCSDGLTDPLADSDIRDVVQAHADDLEGGCKALIDAANDRGGPDNITVVLAKTLAV